jgi:membrane protease YdiL (CAAX protease family)
MQMAGPALNPPMIALIVLILSGILAALGAWAWLIVQIALQRSVLPRVKMQGVPWGKWSIITIINVYIFFQLAAVYVHRDSPKPAGAASNPQVAKVETKAPTISSRDQLLLGSAVNAAILAVILPLLRVMSDARASDLGLPGRPLGRNLLTGVVSYLILAPIVFGTMLIAVQIWKPRAHPVLQMISTQLSPSVAALALVAAVVLAPLTEEILFRGVLLGYFTRISCRLPRTAHSPVSELHGSDLARDQALEIDRRDEAPFIVGDASLQTALAAANPYAPPDGPLSKPAAKPRPPRVNAVSLLLPNILVSVIFAALHGPQWPAPVPLFLLSLGLGYLYQRTGSIVAPIALHATFNGVSTAMLLLATMAGINPTAGFPKPEPKAVPPPAAAKSVAPVPTSLEKPAPRTPIQSAHPSVDNGKPVAK